MVQISDLDEYLHADAIEASDIIRITDKARIVSAEEARFNRAYLEIPVELPNGKRKIWTPNKTTLKNLAKAFGDDTDNWTGKSVKISKTRQNVRGEMRDVIYGEPAEPPSQVQPNLHQ